jgi:predicted transcriptional regulator
MPTRGAPSALPRQRVELLEAVQGMLERAGFDVSERCDLRPVSFDLVARRDRELVMVKTLGNVDALTEPIAAEIKMLCKFLHARPIVVGLRAGTGPLEAGVVYSRHDIPILHPETLESYVAHGQAPMVYAAPGGFYVHLDAQALRRARIVTSVSRVTQHPGFFVVERTTKTTIEGMPVVNRTELTRLDDADAILELILERQGPGADESSG